MIYAISDIHGCYDKYMAMLEKIGFSDDDTLYVLGDVVDRGEDGIRVLFDMLERENVIPIKGNHDYLALNKKDKSKILAYISTFFYFQDIEVGGQKFLLSHTVPPKETLLDFEGCSLLEYVAGDPEYDKVYFEDKLIVTGHTPTFLIDEEYDGRIYKNNNHIAIDCGAVFGGKLGCICLDTMEEFYV